MSQSDYYYSLFTSSITKCSLTPDAPTRSSVAVDGSGTITGMAFYVIQAEKAGLQGEKEQVEVRLKRLQRELDSTKQRLEIERS